MYAILWRWIQWIFYASVGRRARRCLIIEICHLFSGSFFFNRCNGSLFYISFPRARKNATDNDWSSSWVSCLPIRYFWSTLNNASQMLCVGGCACEHHLFQFKLLYYSSLSLQDKLTILRYVHWILCMCVHARIDYGQSHCIVQFIKPWFLLYKICLIPISVSYVMFLFTSIRSCRKSQWESNSAHNGNTLMDFRIENEKKKCSNLTWELINV